MSTEQPPKKKKKYEKPTLSEVALRPEEAVLGNCKSVSISGPDTRLTPDKLPGLIRIGLDTCSKISARLGYHGPASLRAAQSKFMAPRAIV